MSKETLQEQVERLTDELTLLREEARRSEEELKEKDKQMLLMREALNQRQQDSLHFLEQAFRTIRSLTQDDGYDFSPQMKAVIAVFTATMKHAESAESRFNRNPFLNWRDYFWNN